MFRLVALIASLITLATATGCAGFFENETERSGALAQDGLWSLEAESLAGEPVDFSSFEGKVALVVNVASECGFTSQYEGLQSLADRYADRGLVVMGFPSNEFGAQEPGSPTEIAAFCRENYGVTFPMFAKVKTANGDDQSPVYSLLGGATGSLPGWNFGKYLVSRDGKTARFFPSTTAPLDEELIAALEEELTKE